MTMNQKRTNEIKLLYPEKGQLKVRKHHKTLRLVEGISHQHVPLKEKMGKLQPGKYWNIKVEVVMIY